MWLWSAKPADDLGGSLAGLNAPPEFQTTTIESKTNIFRACEPGVVHPTENFMSGEMARQFAYQMGTCVISRLSVRLGRFWLNGMLPKSTGSPHNRIITVPAMSTNQCS